MLDFPVDILLFFLNKLLNFQIGEWELFLPNDSDEVLHLVLINFPNRLIDVHLFDDVLGVIHPVQDVILPALTVAVFAEDVRKLVQGSLSIFVLRIEN